MQIRFDHGPDGGAARFRGAARLIAAREAAEVASALAALDAARAEGAWLAGFASYEMGFALEPRLLPLTLVPLWGRCKLILDFTFC